MILQDTLSWAQQVPIVKDNDSSILFKPYVGSERAIFQRQPTKGSLWFAKDSKKIFYGDGEKFLSMGGNSGIYYSKTDVIKTNGDESSDKTDFIYKILEIDGNESVVDGNYKFPNIDDLIVNEVTKAFYRVVQVYKDEIDVVNNSTIRTEKIAVAGGGGGSVGGGLSFFFFKDNDKENPGFTKYFTSNTKSAMIFFNITSTVTENNQIAEMVISIGQNEVYRNNDLQDFGDFDFDLLPYIPTMSKAVANVIKIRVMDILGTVKEFFYYINVLELLLKSDINNSILKTDNGTLHYYVVPSGGGVLVDREIEYTFQDKNGNVIMEKTISVPVQKDSIGKENHIDLDFSDIGVYGLQVKYKGRVNGTDHWIPSNVLTYSVVSYNENPLLVAFIPSYEIEQYSTLNITYMIAANIQTNELVKVNLRKNDNATVKEVPYNEINSWIIDFDTIGTYDLYIEDSFGNKASFLNIQVYPYEGEVPTIDPSKTVLYLNATGRSNDEILSENKNISERDKWTFGNYTSNFSNFTWGNINGWLRDEDNIGILRLNSGAKLDINFYPFEKNVIELNDNNGGLTIELDFKMSGVIDFQQPLIYCLSRDGTGQIQVGFQITGQESTMNTLNILATGGVILEGKDEATQAYNTAIQGLTAKFIENKRIHLTWVIERNNSEHPMIYTYLNGIRSGITFYNKNDRMVQNNNDPAKITIDSTYGNIDLYNVRVYKRPLSSGEVLDNYIATCGTIDERVFKNNDNKGLLGLENEISVESIENGSYTLSVPYIKITGGESLTKNENDGQYYLNINDESVRLPQTKKDYRLIKELVFVDQNGKHENRKYTSIFKDDGALNGMTMYGQGTSSMEYPIKNLRIKWKMRDEAGEKVKFTVNSNDCPVDLVCLKADYMESSGSHNTGTANLIYKLLNGMKYETPAQSYYAQKNLGYDIITTIRGYPVLVFYRPNENSTYEFIGKYNLNLDKATHEPFGFISDPKNKPNSISEAKFGWSMDDSGNIVNAIHCYEFLNNASDLANFVNTSEKDFEEFFYDITTDTESKETAPNWFHSYESRYPEGEDKQGADIDTRSWFKLCKWVNSTSVNEATNLPLEEEYIDIKGEVHTIDNKQYRLAKFRKEFTEHFDLQFSTFYYVLTHILLMIDSRAKNMMIATWDDQIWYPIFYDMDTMLGLNNYGYNKFNYDVEDTHDNIYNGQKSVLWNNFKECFKSEIKTTYNDLQKVGLTYQDLIDNYNNNQADATNEVVYNADSEYKYISPFNKGYYDGFNGVFVTPGTKDYLYAAQGNRSMHREWWIDNRLIYFNGKYLSDEFKADRYEMRLYTPTTTDNYTAVYQPSERDFNDGLYFIRVGEEGSYSYEQVSSSTHEFVNEDYYYFVKADNRLAESIQSIPSNNDFKLTPLHNQYLSVAYGGDNGITTDPSFVRANDTLHIKTPKGSEFNDTETYIYGGSTLKNLGDLSTQYLGAFKFPAKETKLETLILGNKNNKYYNYNFSNLSIGKSAPYLKTLDITNCSGLSGRDQDVSNCQNIQNIYATGSGLTGISLPQHGVLQELRLPKTLRELTIIDHPYLTTDKFTMGSYDSNTSSYSENDFTSLIFITLEDVPNLNSYEIIKGAVNLQKYSLKNVKWEIKNKEDIDFDNLTIPVLEFLRSKEPMVSNVQSLTGTLLLPKHDKEDELLSLYDKYWKIFPELKFVFTDAKIYDVTVYDNKDNVIWTKKIKNNEYITKEFLGNGPKGQFETPSMDDINDSEWEYKFNNIWKGTMGGSEIIPFYGSMDEITYGWPINNILQISNNIELRPDFTQTKKKYKVIYRNYDNEIISDQEYEYGTSILDTFPSIIPYKKDEDLDYDKTYAFLGYNSDKDAKKPSIFDESYKVSYEITFYAIFEETSVYSNIHHEYFDYRSVTYNPDSNYDDLDTKINGVYVLPKAELGLQGKIIIPAMSPDGQPVIGIGLPDGNSSWLNRNANPTHIFFAKDEKNKTNIIYIGRDSFSECSKLKYFEFTDSLRVIYNGAFKNAGLENYNISGKNLKRIGAGAFINAFNSNNKPIHLFITPSIVRLDHLAIANLNKVSAGSVIEIGSSDEKSALFFTSIFESVNSQADTMNQRIRNNSTRSFKQVIFYSDNYTKQDDYCYTDSNGKEVYLIECIGEGAEALDVW